MKCKQDILSQNKKILSLDKFRLVYCIYFGNSANYNLKQVFPYCYFYRSFVDITVWHSEYCNCYLFLVIIYRVELKKVTKVQSAKVRKPLQFSKKIISCDGQPCSYCMNLTICLSIKSIFHHLYHTLCVFLQS